MSGLEGLVALGLACNIFQTVSFGRETLVLIKEVYRNGTADESLTEKSAAIQDVASDIIAVEIPRPFGKHEQKLFDVTKKCTGVARDLKEEIAFLMGHNTKGSLQATLKTTVKVNWRKRRLERMERDLADSEQLMQSTLLAWIFKSLNTASINIDGLEERVRDFVIKYDQGHRQTSDLVSKEALQVRETIIKESGKSEVAIRDHIIQNSAKVEQRIKDQITQNNRERLRQKLLSSLKYPGMNERANQIEGPHTHTFRWLFADQDNLNRSDEEQYFDDTSSEESGYSCSSCWSNDEHDENRRPEMVWSSFTDWLQSSLSIYWIMGKPGSGKSTLAKYILSEPRTKTLLEQWRHDVIIASHYFWRPGTLMQRNIKGMLCSIAYQLVFATPNALQYASIDVDSLDQKDADTDWAIPELQRLCLGLIRHFGKPVCLLIDGLDECGPEDSHQVLLDVLESFKSQDVKIVASSRNEQVFERRFRHQPQLRIQDLTAGDLRAYATDELHHEIRKDKSFALFLAREAEGVFLWLVLAVQSLNRGFGNGDSVTDLRKRMEILPKRLNDLYKDMWERLNDDADIYRRDAALYFRLVIHVAGHDEPLLCMEDGLSNVEMMFASSEASHKAFAESPISATELLDQCERFRENVEVRCAGLLGAPRGSTHSGFTQAQGLEDTERGLLEHAHKGMRFRFIHRSALDFLVDTTDGLNILQHERRPSEDLDLCIFSASLRAAELLYPVLERVGQRHERGSMYVETEVSLLLCDLSRLAESREALVEALFLRCFELYSSPSLQSFTDYEEMHPARIASFFGVAARYPSLDRYSTNMIEKRLVGHEIRSGILLAIVAIGLQEFVIESPRENLPLKLAQRLLRLDEVDINLKSPLVTNRLFSGRGICNPDRLGPLDHTKASPFTLLLGFGMVDLAWKKIGSIRNSPQMRQFLQLVCDLVSRGADLRSKVFLICPGQWDSLDSSERLEKGVPRVLQISGSGRSGFAKSCMFQDGQPILCVVALEATTVIQRMLTSLLKTDRDSSEENNHSSRNDAVGASNLEAAVSFLTLRCQEYGGGHGARVVGLLQPCGNLADMPYRQVSHQDSVNIVKDLWKYMDISENGVYWDNLVDQVRAAVARSPFSCIGFRDYLRNHGYFDEFAAHTLLMEYKIGAQQHAYSNCGRS